MTAIYIMRRHPVGRAKKSRPISAIHSPARFRRGTPGTRPVQPLRSIMQQRPLTPQPLANLRRAYEMFDTARYTDMDYNTKLAKFPDLLMIHAVI